MIDRQRKVYVPVAHSSEERIWRRVCITLDDDLLNIKYFLCNQIILRQQEIGSTNVSYSEVWLGRGREFFEGYSETHLDNIVEGDCSQYGRTLLLLSLCEEQNQEEGMGMIMCYIQCSMH